MSEKRAKTLEPLLIPTLRFLIALPLVTISVTLLVDFFLPSVIDTLAMPAAMRPPTWPFIAAELIALLLLVHPGLPIKLGRWFLPITLFFCTLGPTGALIAHMLQLSQGALGDSPSLALIGLERMVPLIFFLTIPMIVIAWQYSFRWVVFYTLSLALIEAGIALFLRLSGDNMGLAWTLSQLAIARTVVFLANGYLVSRLIASQRQQRAALAEANSQLVQYALTQEQLAISRERNRLARDLHDTLAHYMSGLVLELEGTRLLWESDSPQARTTLDNAIATARNGLVETRRALQALRSTPLTDLGFNRAVRELATSMAMRNQWQLQLDLPETPIMQAAMIEEVLYRIIQEGLTNIERHAGATRVTLTLQVMDHALQLVLTDDGCGFAPAETKRADKFGLLGMKERSDLISGALQIKSIPSAGVTLVLTVPTAPGKAVGEQLLSLVNDSRKVAITV